MIDDIILNKSESIERCVKQIRSYYVRPSDQPFEEDHFKQDAIAANLQRAAELCIDVANHVVRVRRLGLPKDSRDGFELLGKARIISADTAKRLVGMVGFRNIMVHEYKDLDVGILKDVVENRLDDLLLFMDQIKGSP